MTAPSGREPARPQPGTDATTATPSAVTQPRLSREAVVAFALLPVLLVAGFFLGSRLLGDTTDPGTTTAVGAASDPAAGGEDPAVQGPAVQGPGVETPAGEPAVQGPAAPQEPAQPAEPQQPASPAEPQQPASPAEPAQPASPASPAEPQQPAPPAEPAQPAPPAEPAQPAPPAEPAPAPAPETAVAPAAPVPQAGENVLLFKGFAGEDVRTWQQRMVDRGWSLRVDGIYGPETASVARQFQAQKGLRVDGLVGINTWNAAWTAPIT